jgi:hypothetical protein
VKDACTDYWVKSVGRNPMLKRRKPQSKLDAKKRKTKREASNKWLRVKKLPLRISSRKILSNYKTKLKKENGSAKTALSKINQLLIAALFV